MAAGCDPQDQIPEAAAQCGAGGHLHPAAPPPVQQRHRLSGNQRLGLLQHSTRDLQWTVNVNSF